jgi:hypothetical protein
MKQRINLRTFYTESEMCFIDLIIDDNAFSIASNIMDVNKTFNGEDALQSLDFALRVADVLISNVADKGRLYWDEARQFVYDHAAIKSARNESDV